MEIVGHSEWMHGECEELGRKREELGGVGVKKGTWHCLKRWLSMTGCFFFPFSRETMTALSVGVLF